MRWCNCGEALSASVQRNARQRKVATAARSLRLLLIGGDLLSGRPVPQHLFVRSLRSWSGGLGFLTPQMESVGEDNISHQSIRVIISEIERGINLKVRRDVPSESNRRRILPPALEIDLHPPLLIKIVSVAENRFVFVTGVDRTDDDFVMFGVIASFDIRLRIDITAWGPIDEPDRQQIRLFREDTKLGGENLFIWFEPLEHGNFRPFGKAKLGLEFVWVRNPHVLNLETQGQGAFLL